MRFRFPGVAALAALAVSFAGCSEGGILEPRLDPGSASLAAASAGDTVWISEIHYDNASTDVDERIEISGPAGMSLTGWSVVFYNGSGGASYATKALSGTIPATCGSRGVVVVAQAGIQNGDPDGMALVGPGNVVYEFLSYEGTFAATNGPALGMTSVDIRVRQNGNEPATLSLQRDALDPRAWLPPSTHTFGACNDGGGVVQPGGEVDSVAVTPTTASAQAGASVTFTASAFDATGNAASTTFAWSSSDPAVATVDASTGLVTAVASGTAQIRATSANGKTGSATLTVTVPPPPSGVVISEILADPDAVTDSWGEWFEVYNAGSEPVDLKGWTIVSTGEGAHVVAKSVIVPAGGYAVLGRADDRTRNGDAPVDYNYFVGSNTTVNLTGSDRLELRNAAGATVDVVSWTSGVPVGASRALGELTADNSNLAGSAWFTSYTPFGACDLGTPGAANGNPTPPPAGTITSLCLESNGFAMPAGYTRPTFFTARDGTGASIFPVDITYTTSDAGVATVDARGYVTGTGAGKVTITGTTPNGVKGTITFTITPADEPTSAVYRDHVAFGVPADGDDSDDHIVRRGQFVLSYNSSLGGPNWVSWNLNATQFGAVDRCDCFTADATLPSSFYRVNDQDYRGSGYDRGHMVQSESRTTTLPENAATFLMTNILPQANASNSGPWGRFENYLNDRARQQGKEIYVVAGGEWSDDPETLKGEGKVAIPEFTWKVAVILDGGEGLSDVGSTADLEVIAVRMPNDTAAARPHRNAPWENFRVTVDQIEARVGYDVLSKLPDRIERIVESNDRPPTASVDGPYQVIEGSALKLDASGSTDPDGDALTYAWDFGDGSTGTGAAPEHVYRDNGTYQIKVTVTDPYGAESTATTAVTVFNQPPTVGALEGATLLPGETFAAAGTFADAGDDQWTATVDYGDGSGAQPLALSGKGFALSHRYAAAGTYTVKVTVTDDDGDSDEATATITVRSVAQAIDLLSASVKQVASGGIAASLQAKLDAARNALERGNTVAAVGQMEAFRNEVQALGQAGRLTTAQAAALVADAERILRSLAG